MSITLGGSILVLQTGRKNQPVHVVWGIPRGYARPAVLVTTYRPGTDHWNTTFTERKR